MFPPITCTLPSGPIRDAVASPGFALPAILAALPSGVIRAASGRDLASVVARDSWKDGSHDIAHMRQAPVLQIQDATGALVVFLGRLRAGIVVHATANRKLSVSRFVLSGGRDKLAADSVIVHEQRDGWLLFEELVTGLRTGVSWDAETGLVDVDIDYDRRLLAFGKPAAAENYEHQFRTLLRGVEELSEREAELSVENAKVEELIASYSSAMLFVSEWKERNVNDPARTGARSCSLSVDKAPALDSPRFHLPTPVVGRECFVTVTFQNTTGITLGEGWMLRLLFSPTVRPNPALAKEAESNLPADEDAEESMTDLAAPLGLVAPGTAKAISFPVTINSHKPVTVSVSLRFQHPARLKNGIDGVDVEVYLQENTVLDILHFGRKAARANMEDISHKFLAAAQLQQHFDGEAVEKKKGHPLMSRLELPYASEAVTRVLGMESETGHVETVLGGQFTLSVAETIGAGSSDAKGETLSTISIRGAPYIVPFVRAAVIRRMLANADPSSVIIQGSASIERWQRTLTDTADECLASYRRAESQLVEAVQLHKEIERGSIEYCFRGRDRETVAGALRSARAAYGMWRRRTEHLWTPKGFVLQ